ncbi:MAG: DUF456 domain-containing protein [Aquimonas sp.]|nr:DUF456 domain-containing protein [Aquimonas sp.]
MDFTSLLPYLLYTLAAAMVLVGVAGTVLPALPGIPLMFAGMLLAAWVGDFSLLGWPTLTVLVVLTVLSVLADLLAGLMGAKRVGASVWALAGAAVGTVVGLFFGLFGLLLGPFVGALLGELIAGGTLRRAAHVGLGTWIGIVIGAVLKVAIAFSMLGVFAFALVF